MSAGLRIEPNIAPVAALFGEPSRAAILTVLLDGRALPAGEIARIAGVNPSAASGHLAKLIDGRLLTVHAEGRHRYYRLANEDVAAVIEDLAQLSGGVQAFAQPPLSPAMSALREARSCYDHLAGRLAVAIAIALERRGWLVRGEGKRYEIGNGAARRWLAKQCVNLDALKPGRHGLARQCLDWTERRPHIAGPLGTQLFARWCERGWLRRAEKTSRRIEVTDRGRRGLRAELGISVV